VTVEQCICRAEIAYKSGRIKSAVGHAKRALKLCPGQEKAIALKIFVARAYSKLGRFSESNTLYRELITEQVYLPPVIMGLMYNNFKAKNPQTQKISRNLSLVKIFVR